MASIRLQLTLLCALAGVAAPAVAAGSGVYKWVDGNGVTHYTNVPGDQARERDKTRIAVSSVDHTFRAAIYKSIDANGVVHYSDRKPRGRSYQTISFYCPACDPASKVNWSATRLNLTAYANEINAAALQNGVDPALVRALIHAESSFNPNAVSRKGAQGLMQLMPATALQYGVSDPFDAVSNINAGVQHLADLIKQYDGDIKLVAAAYNAGAGAVKKYGGVPPYDETRVYVERVGTLHKRYQAGS
jgi:soluble lytic murein transglycosylase-like protein